MMRVCETIWHLMWTKWQKVDNLAEKFRLAQMLQDRGRKRNYAYYANNVNYANYVKRCLT